MPHHLSGSIREARPDIENLQPQQYVIPWPPPGTAPTGPFTPRRRERRKAARAAAKNQDA